MSTLSSSETTTRLATLPRVNLLPPEIEVQRRAKKVQGALGLGVVAALGIVGVLVLAANGQVSDAETQLEAEQARNSALEAQAAEYAEVPAVYAAVDAAETELTRAMNKEIRWSYFLNDLSLATPGKVWLTSVTVTENVDATPVAATPAVAGTATYGTPNIGSVTVSGKGYTHNDVASWLRALSREEGLADPFFTQSIVESIGTENAVSFESQAVITEDLLSGRFTEKAGN